MPNEPKHNSTEPVPLRRLLALAWPERWRLLAGLLFLLVGSAMALAWPKAVQTLIDEALAPAGDLGFGRINQIAGVLLVLFLVQAVAVAFRYYLFSLAGERIVLRLRRRLFGALMQREIGFFDASRTGDLLSRLTADSTAVQSVLTSSLSMALRNLVLVAGGVALLLWTSPALTGWMLVLVPPVAIGAVFFGGKIRKLSRAAHDALADSNHAAEESLAGVRTVRSFAREAFETERYSEKIQASFDLFRRRALFAAAFLSISFFSAFASLALVFWKGGRLVVMEELSVGGLTAFLLYTMTVAMAITGLGELWAELSRARGASERVFELIGEERLEESADQASGQRVPLELQHVHFDDVSFRYPTRPEIQALNKVNLTLKRGQVMALVGPSGAGKSTLAALLLRHYEPSSGGLTVNGEAIDQWTVETWRQSLGAVSQGPLLFSTTVAANIRYGRLDASQAEVEAAARDANAHEFIAALPEGYDTEVGERGLRLSAGQKQRVAIARALIRDPQLLVLDEATSSLDAESEHLVQQALERLMKGRTTVIIAHRLSTVRQADEVLVLDKGQVVERGRHDELLAQDGLYRRLVWRQFAGAPEVS